MKQYKVRVRYSDYATIVVDAENEKDASEKAKVKFSWKFDHVSPVESTFYHPVSED
jgi:hypothetical protein